MSGNASVGISGLRSRLAEKYSGVAAAIRQEDGFESVCLGVRQQLAEERKRQKLDQATVADRMQVGQPMISRIENGGGEIGLMTVLRYAAALGKTVEITLKDA